MFNKKSKTDIIILLVGKSATGKSTICNYLAEYYDWKVLKSYTTRPMRINDDSDINTHTFVTKEQFDKLKHKCAYTKFDEYEYCATQKQVDKNDIYVIDPKGVKYFREHYNGCKQPIVVYIDGHNDKIIKNMYLRGDNKESIERRIENDSKEFDKFYDYNYLIPMESIEIETMLIRLIKERETMKLAERKLP